MAFELYNTLTQRREPFVPLSGDQVGIYVCGVTVYDKPHIGHARSTVVFDVLVRYLRYKGYQVVYVRNFTDVDDKIINRAREENRPWHEIAEENIEEFHKEMKQLHTLPPDVEPRATEHITEMIVMIEKLIEKGHAYHVNGNVYFSVESFEGYGKLSHRSLDELKAGARLAVNPEKRNPLDFALWKKSLPGEPSWASPWGKGRPGWHIECSAMSTKYLGPTLDIHGGGKDLIFPHHENEIAQSEGTYEKKFVRYWVHNGFVTLNGEKMSKSTGNFLTLEDVLKRFDPEAIRLFLLSKQYRKPLDFSEKGLQEAQKALNRLYEVRRRIRQINWSKKGNVDRDMIISWRENLSRKFQEAMDNDLNTPQAIGTLFEYTRELNQWLDKSRDTRPQEEKKCLFLLDEEIEKVGSALGLFNKSPEEFFSERLSLHLEKVGLSEKELQEMIDKRAKARKQKDWKTADQIRDDLSSKGIALKDTPTGTVYSIAD